MLTESIGPTKGPDGAQAGAEMTKVGPHLPVAPTMMPTSPSSNFATH